MAARAVDHDPARHVGRRAFCLARSLDARANQHITPQPAFDVRAAIRPRIYRSISTEATLNLRITSSGGSVWSSTLALSMRARCYAEPPNPGLDYR